MFRRFRKNGLGIVALALIAAVALPAAAATSTPSASKRPLSQASQAATESITLEEQLLQHSKWVYDLYAEELTKLKDRIDAARKELDALRQRLDANNKEFETLQKRLHEIDRSYRPPFPPNVQEEVDAINKAIRANHDQAEAINKAIQARQELSSTLSDEIKAKNLLLQQYFDMLSQVASALNKQLTDLAKKIDR